MAEQLLRSLNRLAGKFPSSPFDVSDRPGRLLGILYGSQGQQLLQRASTYDLIVQLRSAGTEIDPRSIRALTSSDIVTVQQATRTSLLMQPEREDIISLAFNAAPNAAGVQIIAPSGSTKVKVYDAGYHAKVAGVHYFYFGTSTTPTTRTFCTVNDAIPIHKTFVQPRVSNAGDGLYLYASVNESGGVYGDVGYKQE